MSRLSNIFLCCIALLCCSARGEFTHPFLASGEVYTNTMMLDLFHARFERTDAISDRLPTNSTGFQFIPRYAQSPIWVVSYQAYTGVSTEVSIITNGIYVITNRIDTPQYDTVPRTNDACLMPFVWEGYTNEPHVTRFMISGQDDPGTHTGAIDGWNYEDGGETAPYWQTAFYVQHWLADGDGLFNGWLNTTDGSGNYPTVLPVTWEPGEIMSYTNIGYVTNILYDAFGLMTNTAWGWTRSPPTTQNWNVAEVYYDGSNFVFREQVPLDYNHFAGSRPVFMYTQGKNIGFTNLTFTISGEVFSTYDGGRDVGTEGMGNQDTINTSEIANATNASFADANLANSWQRITNITAASGDVTAAGDTWSVVYTNKVTLYGDMAWNLSANDHNERRSFVDALRWSYDDRSLSSHVGYKWVGTSTNSWADAKTNAENATPSFIAATRAERWTTGEISGGTVTWTATARAVAVTKDVERSSIHSSNRRMSPDYEHAIDLYYSADIKDTGEAAGVHVLDTFSDSAWLNKTNVYQGVADVYLGYATQVDVGSTNELEGFIGSTNFPPTWCAEPSATNTPTSRGYVGANKAMAVIRWDATTNGFKYIR